MKIFNKFRGTRGFLSTAHNALKWAYMIPEKAKHTYRVVCFRDRHGPEAALEAFKVKKRTLYGRKRKFKEGCGKPEALHEQSKAPRKRRTRTWPLEILNEIKRLRENYPNLGKDTIYPELKIFCHARNLKCPKPKTIGRLISDRGGLRTFPRKVSHFGKIKKTNRQKVLRKPKDFKPHYAGHLAALDTIEKFV